MQSVPFYLGEEDGSFYAVASCVGQYDPLKASKASRIALYFSPSIDFSRFSVYIIDAAGEILCYHRGPEDARSIEAAMLDAWAAFSVPVYSWELFDRSRVVEFKAQGHEALYWDARRECARVLYVHRMRAYTMANARPLFGPPAGGFVVPDAFAITLENEELSRATIDPGAD